MLLNIWNNRIITNMEDVDKTMQKATAAASEEGTRKREGTENRDWDTATFAGLMFSLAKFKDRLTEQRGFKLNSGPREIDVRIIAQDYNTDDRMDNAIAYLFERHNLIELKNPYEELNIDIVWKGISYAAQYKSMGYDDIRKKKGVDIIPMKDVTLTFLRISKPDGLFKNMLASGYGVEMKFPGVYYITGIADIKMQVVVGTELVGEEFSSLRVQKHNAKDEDIRAFVSMVERLKDRHERDLADAILQISVSENKDFYDRLRKEEPEMCDALRDLFKDEIEAEVNAAVSENTISMQENFAKMLLADKKPMEEILKYTHVPLPRLKKLADGIGS